MTRMDLVKRKKLEITVEGAILRRVEELLVTAGVKGHTVLHGAGGRGEGGRWSEDLLTRAEQKVLIYAITSAERADKVLEALREIFATWPGIVAVTDVEVMRAERF
jgi:PII-like signaling protein